MKSPTSTTDYLNLTTAQKLKLHKQRTTGTAVAVALADEVLSLTDSGCLGSGKLAHLKALATKVKDQQP